VRPTVASIIVAKVVVTPAFGGIAAATTPTPIPTARPHHPDSSHDAPRIPRPPAVRVNRPVVTVRRSSTVSRREDGHHAATRSRAISTSPMTSDQRYSESNR